MKKTLIASACLVFGLAGAAQAEENREGQTALFLDAPFSGSPGYNIGRFINDETLIYGTVRLVNGDAMDSFGLGGGARFYTDLIEASELRSFWDVSLMISDADIDTPGDNVDIRTTTLGGHFGLEFPLSRSATIGTKVGVLYRDTDFDGDSTSELIVGDARVQLNIYW